MKPAIAMKREEVTKRRRDEASIAAGSLLRLSVTPSLRLSRGFTLIELLVVVTIIVVLLAMLVPAMDKAIEASLRAVCATRLHSFGLGIGQYSMDNKRRVPLPVQAYGGPYPSLIRNTDSQGPGQWSGQVIGPYVGGADIEAGIYSEQWYCPSNGKTAEKDAANRDAAAGLVSVAGGNFGWLALDYAYFARITSSDHATFPQELVGHNTMAAGKLLMADTIYYWQGGDNNSWWFNHHRDGPSMHDAPWGSPNMSGQQVEGLSGTNQLFGDGAVVWKDGSKFFADEMWQPHQELRFVSPTAGPSPAADLNFY